LTPEARVEVVSIARGKYMIFSDCSFLMVSLMGPLGTFLDGYLFGGVMITLVEVPKAADCLARLHP
jgi:hypothetical protein